MILVTDRHTDRPITDICDCRVAFATEKLVASVTLAFSFLIGYKDRTEILNNFIVGRNFVFFARVTKKSTPVI